MAIIPEKLESLRPWYDSAQKIVRIYGRWRVGWGFNPSHQILLHRDSNFARNMLWFCHAVDFCACVKYITNHTSVVGSNPGNIQQAMRIVQM